MESLPRTLQKIFGLTGDTDQFGKVGSDSAGSPAVTKNLDEIQSLSQFEAGLFSITANLANPPRGEDFNALLYLITSQLKYLFQSGVPEWLATENYYANKSVVIGSDGNLYKSKTGSDVSPNINHNPVGDTTNWSIVWDITNDGTGSGLDADIVRGTTPGAGGLSALAKAVTIWAADNDGSGSGLDADIVRGTTPGTRGLQYLAAAAASNIAELILTDLKNTTTTSFYPRLDPGETWTIPEGLYMFADNNSSRELGIALQIKWIDSGTTFWIGVSPPSGLVLSDGINYRLQNIDVAPHAHRVVYRKLV